MKLKNYQKLRSILEDEFIAASQQERSELRDKAMSNVMKIQQENKKAADRKRKVTTSYEDGNLVAILRTNTSADHMKPWPTRRTPYFNPDFEDNFEASDDNEGVIKSRMADCGTQNPTNINANTTNSVFSILLPVSV